MKKILLPLITIVLVAEGCTTKDLNVESKTSITTSYLYSTPEGLSRAAVGLYPKDRAIANQGESPEYAVLMFDYCTDLMIFRAGTAAGMARLDTPNSSTDVFKSIWNKYYSIIGKANEIIYYAEQLGLENETVARAYAEAKVFRARSYFLLYQRFERLYINTEPTTTDNITGRVYRPASSEAILSLIKQDLEDAMPYLDWTVPSGSASPQYGRMTKAVAKHIRAQVAMWESDWDSAITNCEDIFECPDYGMMATMADVFNGADLRNKEVLYSFQFSNEQGGGSSISDGVAVGHRLSLITTCNYKKALGYFSLEYGGYGWGRVYPNTYLLGLYDPTTDNRYKDMFIHKFYYNDPDHLPAGKSLGDEVIPSTGAQYLECLHPMSKKFFDQWTNADNIERRSSFKDAIIYRLAETYLIAAEAYFHKEGGSSIKAHEYFNETYRRANLKDFTAPLTMDEILNEYARELNFEGVRWPLLKRLGLLEERVVLHAGDTKKEDPLLASDYIQPRKNFSSKWWRWPIPQDILDVMPGYGQNEDWY